MNIKQKFDRYGCPQFNVKPHKGMTWLDLADAICEHKKNLLFCLVRSFLWDDQWARSGKWVWCASFQERTKDGKYENVSGGRLSASIDETIIDAVKRLLGNNLIRSPYAVFKSLEKDHHWHLPYEDEPDITFTLKLN